MHAHLELIQHSTMWSCWHMPAWNKALFMCIFISWTNSWCLLSLWFIDIMAGLCFRLRHFIIISSQNKRWQLYTWIFNINQFSFIFQIFVKLRKYYCKIRGNKKKYVFFPSAGHWNKFWCIVCYGSRTQACTEIKHIKHPKSLCQQTLARWFKFFLWAYFLLDVGGWVLFLQCFHCYLNKSNH